MTGVVVWSYMNNRNLWSPYEPDVSCELERLFASGTQQTVNLGTVSPNLSCYDVNFALMKQTTNSSGSVRDIKRSFHGPTSALGQGVVWEYEGELPSQWNVYDIETMELLEEHFTRRNHLNSSVFDLQQTRLCLPYIIDFSNMTQMRVDTGKVRQIKRRSMKQHFPPIPAQSLSTSFPAMSTSAVYTVPSGQPNWQPGQLQPKSVAGRSKYRQQPYSLSKSGAHGHFHGSNGLVGLPAQGQQQNLQQQQQSSQNPGPLTRKKVQQTTHTAPAPTLHQNMQTQHPTAQSAYSSPQQQLYFQQQALQNLHIGSYQHTSGFAQGSHQSYQYPSSTLTQTYTVSPLTIMAPALEHQRSNGTSSSSSLMPTCGSHTSQSLPNVTKVTIGKSKKSKSKTGQQILETFMRSIHTDLDKSDCSICFDKLSEPSSYGEGRADACVAVELIRCGHQYHKLCLLEMHRSIHKDDSLQCPSCKTIYGEKTGICPPGYMQWKLVHDLTLSGYEGHGTIIVSYHIHSGTQGPEHPCPGQSYSARGFPRQGFLPDCDKGRKVLKLLMEAFRRRLMFTIATSHTTGESNTVTWNEIHHKTEPSGNTTGHGYPDPNYLDNVLMELAAHGVTEDCLT